MYSTWTGEHDWSEIAIPNPNLVPSPWRAYVISGRDECGDAEFTLDTWETYNGVCQPLGINIQQVYREFFNDGLGHAMQAGLNNDLHEGYDYYGLSAEQVHRAQTSFVNRLHLIPTATGFVESGTLAETILTNVGEGEPVAYERLHAARLKAGVLASQLFKDPLETIRHTRSADTESLSRALVDRVTNPTEFDHPIYNPLLASFMEGLISVGQGTNYLIQGGVPEQVSTADDIMNVLRNKLPVTLSKTMVNGHLGPNQMAGLAIKGALKRQKGELRVSDSLIRVHKDDLTRSRATLMAKTNDEVKQFLEDPSLQSVNRRRGCPAPELVALACRILLDAYSSSE